MNKKARIIAFYLPQFHPIPENDVWWGKGFTEWTNVGKAKPLFKGHYQPRVPADLGYYDLRYPEIRELQAGLARDAGIEGFCYWHYWFGNGKELLEQPFNDVVRTGKPDFPFCLGWANHSWSNKSWSIEKGATRQIFIEQTYNGLTDIDLHFNMYLTAFKDSRYIKVDGKCLFIIFDPYSIPDMKLFSNRWNELSQQNGLDGFHFVGMTENYRPAVITKDDGRKKLKKLDSVSDIYNFILNIDFDAVNSRGVTNAQWKSKLLVKLVLDKVLGKYTNIGFKDKYNYAKIIKNLIVEEDSWENVYPTIIPNYDRSARSGKIAQIWHGSTPTLFKKHVKAVLQAISNKTDDHKIVFLKSWNEWAEGNYMEPDLKWGKGYITALREALDGDGVNL
jgi:hypothetical protein